MEVDAGPAAGAALAPPSPEQRADRGVGLALLVGFFALVGLFLAVAAEEGADLLVVGRRGAGRNVGPLGSTSEAILAASTVPVVILPHSP